jgi:hypothetical protein
MTAASGGLFRANQIRRYSHVSGDMIEGKYSVELSALSPQQLGARARTLQKMCRAILRTGVVLYDRARELARSDRS